MVDIKNKKGFFLAEETLKIVIALICVTLLIYLLTSLYYRNVNDKRIQQAKSILLDSPNSLSKIIDEVQTNGEPKTFFITNPSGWYFFSFYDKFPNSCSGISCVCLCDRKIDFNGYLNRQLTGCDKDGFCINVPELSKDSSNDFKINNPSEGLTEISISKLNNEILVKQNEK